MEKLAQTDYPIIDVLQRRWSPRAFSTKPVEKEKLLACLEAARWAASSNNEQPWSYLVATAQEPEEFAKLVSCLVPGNQIWAKQAPVLMISVMKTVFSKNGTPNRVAMHDVGAASAQLTAQAMSLGLFVHQMGGIELSKIKVVYGLPDNHEPVAGLAVGYPGDPALLPDEKLREREMTSRVRKPLDQFVFSGSFGNVSSLLK